MLDVQVNYWRNQETKRHNVAVEKQEKANLKETRRHNRKDERLGRDTLRENSRHNKVWEGETHRHNLAGEAELHRHNVAGEALGWSTLNEDMRHNAALEAEQHRHNVKGEALSHESNIVNAGRVILPFVTPGKKDKNSNSRHGSKGSRSKVDEPLALPPHKYSRKEWQRVGEKAATTAGIVGGSILGAMSPGFSVFMP